MLSSFCLLILHFHYYSNLGRTGELENTIFVSPMSPLYSASWDVLQCVVQQLLLEATNTLVDAGGAITHPGCCRVPLSSSCQCVVQMIGQKEEELSGLDLVWCWSSAVFQSIKYNVLYWVMCRTVADKTWLAEQEKLNTLIFLFHF